MEKQQTEVVVLGAGYAGLLATIRLAGKLHRAHRPDVRVTLVNASDMFVERLRLHEFAAKRTAKARPISRLLSGTRVNFVQGRVTAIDTARRAVMVETGAELMRLRYDRLVYAIGSRADLDSVPGVREYAYTLSPDGARSAVDLKARLVALNELGGRVVVCGGGATGIEAAAEFAGAYRNLKVSLVTSGTFGRLWATEIPEVESYMRQSLEKLGVEICDHTTVTQVGANEVLTERGALPADVCLWTGGFVALPLAREAGLAVNERGQLLVDPFLKSVSHPEIIALGDAADPGEQPGVKVRMSAFTAIIMGAYGADCLSAELLGSEPQPFHFIYLGQGIALGPRNAVGFGSYWNDIPHSPFFKGGSGYTIRSFGVLYLGSLAFRIERMLPGAFFWAGKHPREREGQKPQKRLVDPRAAGGAK